MKNIKAFLSKVNCKINTVKLNELFQEVDKRHRNELSFDDFAKLYQIIMLPSTVSKNYHIFACPHAHDHFLQLINDTFGEIIQKYSKNREKCDKHCRSSKIFC